MLIAVNLVVSLRAFAAFRNRQNAERFLMVPAEVAAGRNLAGAVASQFSHADPAHLLFNMLSLYFFGPVVEEALGRLSMLLLYMLCAVASSLLTVAVHRQDPSYRALGASGAISGVVFASIVLRPELNIFLFFVPVPIPGPLFALGYVILSMIMAVRGERGIGHEAHLGGAIMGFLLAGAMSTLGFTPLLDRIRQLAS